MGTLYCEERTIQRLITQHYRLLRPRDLTILEQHYEEAQHVPRVLIVYFTVDGVFIARQIVSSYRTLKQHLNSLARPHLCDRHNVIRSTCILRSVQSLAFDSVYFTISSSIPFQVSVSLLASGYVYCSMPTFGSISDIHLRYQQASTRHMLNARRAPPPRAGAIYATSSVVNIDGDTSFADNFAYFQGGE